MSLNNVKRTYECLYTHQKIQKNKKWQEGFCEIIDNYGMTKICLLNKNKCCIESILSNLINLNNIEEEIELPNYIIQFVDIHNYVENDVPVEVTKEIKREKVKKRINSFCVEKLKSIKKKRESLSNNNTTENNYLDNIKHMSSPWGTHNDDNDNKNSYDKHIDENRSPNNHFNNNHFNNNHFNNNHFNNNPCNNNPCNNNPCNNNPCNNNPCNNNPCNNNPCNNNPCNNNPCNNNTCNNNPCNNNTCNNNPCNNNHYNKNLCHNNKFQVPRKIDIKDVSINKSNLANNSFNSKYNIQNEENEQDKNIVIEKKNNLHTLKKTNHYIINNNNNLKMTLHSLI
ncbi:conserved Plasmodium protein, unknown function [Plasmodium sp.]|nr:conserved Plasmodium protein, unknown function [Plasmodium sp.]